MKSLKTIIASTFAAITLLCSVAAAEATYTKLDYPGGQDTVATSINNLNQVVGWYSVHRTGANSGFMYDQGVYTSIAPPGAINTYPRSINDSGVIVGYYTTNVGAGHGFTYDGQTYTTFDYPDGDFTTLTGINNDGTIVGYTSVNGMSINFSYSNGVFTTIPEPGAEYAIVEAINNLGDIAGEFSPLRGQGFNGQKGVLQVATGARRIIVYNGSEWNYVYGLNDQRHAVGYTQTTDEEFFGFLFKHGVFKLIIPPGLVIASKAHGINNSDYIVGCFSDSVGEHGFLRVP